MAKRSERLLELMQALRRRRRPVAGQVLADEMGVSLRSLYRDIETLKSMGAAIDGEAGLGFQLRADYFMPPLMFGEEELEALVLGLRTLIHGPDEDLSNTARNAMSKIGAVLPKDRRADMEAVGLFALPRRKAHADSAVLGDLRTALRRELQVRLTYRTPAGEVSQRVIYPLALGYDDEREVLVAWCTLREDFRTFRADRMASVTLTDEALPEPRRTLFYRWRTVNNLPELE
jgi:predicted DNA-binding transcriptional regulator YafY